MATGRPVSLDAFLTGRFLGSRCEHLTGVPLANVDAVVVVCCSKLFGTHRIGSRQQAVVCPQGHRRYVALAAPATTWPDSPCHQHLLYFESGTSPCCRYMLYRQEHGQALFRLDRGIASVRMAWVMRVASSGSHFDALLIEHGM